MKNTVTRHARYMRQAIALALKAAGSTSPNPMVGCIIVKNGRVISRGYHKKAGGPHAEVEALKKARNRASGATMYVTLEPCDRYGRTPPCTDAIINSGIKKVYIGTRDPNPKNNGRGANKLKRHGISVVEGVCQREAFGINAAYNKFIRTGIPFVTLKIAESLDGKIATRTGRSKWISSKRSRNEVRSIRRTSDAVLIGVNTVIKDDPGIMPDGESGHAAVRIVLDTNLRIPLGSRIVRTAGGY
jgi:riboflavin biosynthesis protein RibD